MLWTLDQAMAYGRRIGVKYLVKNSLGGTLGGFTTLEAAEKFAAEQKRAYKKNPWNPNVTVYIEEVKK